MWGQLHINGVMRGSRAGLCSAALLHTTIHLLQVVFPQVSSYPPTSLPQTFLFVSPTSLLSHPPALLHVFTFAYSRSTLTTRASFSWPLCFVSISCFTSALPLSVIFSSSFCTSIKLTSCAAARKALQPPPVWHRLSLCQLFCLTGAVVCEHDATWCEIRLCLMSLYGC